MLRRENVFFPPHRRQHFREKFFRCPFRYPKVPLEAGAPPPQSFDASYAPEFNTVFMTTTVNMQYILQII
jgi:hypothetical protein